MRTIKILWILLLGMVSIPFWAQDAGICISGKITDANGCPMESVTLLLLHAADSSYVTGGITDTNGLFAFAGLKPQDYYLEVTMLGFRKQYIPIRFLTDRQSKNLGTLVLEEDSRMLSGVTVTGKRSLMKMEPGTTTFHMDAMASGSQGNVLDALRSLPGVVVNEDGSVLLNGQPGIHVLVNGKSTYLSGDKLVNYLRSMPVSSIKDIELVTNPSAKYDASGKTGLIDIRTQKVATKGWTAHVNTGYQQNQDGRWNAGGRFTWQIRVDHLESELKLLKAQYHPHFLFNALNTVNFQIDEENEEAIETIDLLSSLLRYQLYDINGQVPVHREMDYLQNYIRFQKLRMTERLQLQCYIDPALQEQTIHPLLFQPLLENAFKYVGGDYKLNVDIHPEGNAIHFKVTNSVALTDVLEKEKKGIGIENLKRRLDLLYPGKHELGYPHPARAGL